MKKVKGDGWETDVPNKGWLILNAEIVELPGDEAFRRAQETSSGQVYWKRSVAVEQFNITYEADESVETPVG